MASADVQEPVNNLGKDLIRSWQPSVIRTPHVVCQPKPVYCLYKQCQKPRHNPHKSGCKDLMASQIGEISPALALPQGNKGFKSFQLSI